MIPFSGSLEQKLQDDPDNAKSYLEENKTTSNLEKIIVTGFKALGLMYFFTVGTDEVGGSWEAICSYLHLIMGSIISNLSLYYNRNSPNINVSANSIELDS